MNNSNWIQNQFSGTQILLIEDSTADAAIFVSIMKKGLTSEKYQIHHALSLNEGIEVLKINTIDIVILDYGLPDTDGLEGLKKIHQFAPEIPILILTGLEDDVVGMQAIENGAQDYLVKGILPPSSLSRAMKYAIHRKKVESDLLDARERAIRSERFQSTFLANMSHEIRSPLGAILGFIELANDPKIKQEDRNNFLSKARLGGEVLLGLVNDILDVSAIKEGQMRIDFQSFDLKQIAYNTISLLEGKANQKAIQLKLIFDSSVPQFIWGDAKRLQQILMNLISNAIKFTIIGSVVLKIERITPNRNENVNIKFSVIDTGVGIPEKEQKRLFNMFEQLHSPLIKNVGGTGLGLYISQQLAEKMGGKINVNSTPNEGSCFYFSIEFKEVSNIVPIHCKQDFFIKNKNKPLTVLLIDDSLDQQIITKAFLKSDNCDVTVADNGFEGLEMLYTQNFDLILMDMQMPIMDGYKTAQEFRNWELKNNKIRTPIVALSGSVLKEEVSKSLSSGCDLFLGKPFRKQELTDVINRALLFIKKRVI